MSDAFLPEPAGALGDPVVLLHGLGRSKLAMLPLAFRLTAAGYTPINVGYFGPAGLEKSVAKVADELERRLEPQAGRPIHFVTHSMGGIVARRYLTGRGAALPAGRLVQLAPPNQGAWMADAVRKAPLLEKVPALNDLGTDDAGLRADVAPLERWQVGVIAGKSFGPWHRGHENDGVVRVGETYLPEARDWILLEHFHTVVMAARDTWEHVLAFLQTGRFGEDAPRLVREEGGVVTIVAPDGTRAPLGEAEQGGAVEAPSEQARDNPA